MPQEVNAVAVNGAISHVLAFAVAVGNKAKEQPVLLYPQEPSSVVSPPQVVTTVPAATSLQPCGGSDYPPCYVAQRESGGSYSAYAASGCHGPCYGKWQFDGRWAGKLGLPADLSTATPAQQDEAARQLWNHGAGCSNWSAC